MIMSRLLDSGYYDEHDLKDEGFKALGQNVRIAKNSTVIGIENISIGNHVRIDGYCSVIAAFNGYVTIGPFIHIGACCALLGGAGIVIDDFCGLSQGVKIYSRDDDYSVRYLTGPTVPSEFRGGAAGEVILKRHVIVGSGSLIMPKVIIGEGSAVGALSMVNKNLDSWGIYAGCPARRIRNRFDGTNE
jgi:galactoside O-acetyltransferase